MSPSSATAFTIVGRDDMDRTGKWTLVRRSLGLASFGMNLVDLQPGESIPEHDETDRDQEEVFVVLEGSPTMVIDGKRHLATAGTFVRVDPEPRRTVINETAVPASVLIASAPRTSGYRPLDWA